jgi:hypothetical protein
MKTCRISLLLVLPLLLVVSPGARAATQQVTLVVPEALDVISIDNVKYSAGLFSSGDTTLKLAPGQHKIVVEYYVIIDISSDDHEAIKSEPFQIAFYAKPGKDYYINIPSTRNVKEARQYAKKPVIVLIDRSTKQHVTNEVTYREFDGTFSTQFNAASGTTQQKSGAVTANATPQQSGVNTDSDTPLKMLEYWWQQASAQQRKQFIESRK